jgi:hypothetical protein
MRSGLDVLISPNASSGDPRSQVAKLLLLREDDRRPLVIDGRRERIGQRGHETKHLEVDVGHWFALKGEDERPLFALPGIYRQRKGPIKKDEGG